MRKWTMVISCGLALIVSAGNVASGGDAKKDAKALQGTWTVADPDIPVRQITFSGNKFKATFEEDGKKAEFAGTFKLHTKTNPKGIDMKVTKGPKAEYKGKVSLGIYKIEKGKMTWCANAPGREGRPSEFAAQAGDAQFLLVTLEKKK